MKNAIPHNTLWTNALTGAVLMGLSAVFPVFAETTEIAEAVEPEVISLSPSTHDILAGQDNPVATFYSIDGKTGELSREEQNMTSLEGVSKGGLLQEIAASKKNPAIGSDRSEKAVLLDEDLNFVPVALASRGGSSGVGIGSRSLAGLDFDERGTDLVFIEANPLSDEKEEVTLISRQLQDAFSSVSTVPVTSIGFSAAGVYVSNIGSGGAVSESGAVNIFNVEEAPSVLASLERGRLLRSGVLGPNTLLGVELGSATAALGPEGITIDETNARLALARGNVASSDAIPEPSTGLFVFVGLGLICFFRRSFATGDRAKQAAQDLV